MTGGQVAVVTIAHGRHEHLRAQHASLARGDRVPDHYVVVAMDDPGVAPGTVDGLTSSVRPLDADPRGLPLAAARNLGAESAIRAGAETLVFLDVDCLAGPGLVSTYAAAVADRPDAVWSGPVTYLSEPPPGGYRLEHLDALDAPHPGRPDPGRGHVAEDTDPDLFWSLSFALSTPTWRHLGGFCEDYVGYGGEDTDFGHLVVARDRIHACHGSARAYHQWHPTSSPPVQHVDDILRNAELYRTRWGRYPMQTWLEAFEARGLVVRCQGRWRRAGRAGGPPYLS